MPSVSFTMKQFQTYIRKLRGALVGWEGAATRGVHSGVMRGVGIAQAATVNAMPASPRGSIGAVDTGAYRQAWQFELTKSGGRVFNTRPYAGVVEYGRKKGARRPPPKQIELWARRKLGLSRKEAKSASFAIANAIAKRGLLARKVLTGPLTNHQLIQAVMMEVRREVTAALDRWKAGQGGTK